MFLNEESCFVSFPTIFSTVKFRFVSHQQIFFQTPLCATSKIVRFLLYLFACFLGNLLVKLLGVILTSLVSDAALLSARDSDELDWKYF